MEWVNEEKTGGRFKHHYKFWSKICRDKQILRDISDAKIPFVENAQIVQKPNMIPRQIKMNKVAMEFVDNEVKKLLKMECITGISGPLLNRLTSNIFLVPKKDGCYRLILNLKPLNKFLKYQKLKMDNIENLIKMLRPLDWLSSVDIKSAYLYIPMSRSYFPFLQFRWKNRLFFYNSLPFSIAIGPILFVRVTKGIMNYLRWISLKYCFTLMTLSQKNASRDQLLRDIDMTIDVFQKCGFTINWKKSVLIPTQKLVFLGLVIDTVCFTVSLMDEKKLDILEIITKALNSKKMSVQFLGKVIGKFSSMPRRSIILEECGEVEDKNIVQQWK